MADDATLICQSADLEEKGHGVRFQVDLNGQKLPAFVIRFDGKPRAFLNQCGHVPVELDWMEGMFFDSDGAYLICSTHGALYSPETGKCISGRCAGRGLTPVNVVEEQERIYLAPQDET